MMDTQRPLDALGKSINTNITVFLKDGKEIKGRLKAYDLHMNVALENAKLGEKEYPMLVVRGDNVLYVSL
ncbi:small nuclear ribonucleoprotein [Methanococcus voltae]|jgi:small nuclear ribonucleoprotein|uniref:Putative snRNP Sm-like protein n=2 Tax=Methanococcus voltae TaxID=2188 RepID=A0A8J7RM54_METVO|nr:LSm family protein [Methanococcus voltae]MBP2143438.1 small nuclear ribonucleoprotein [Methanococcus voltae]MBP2172687.1 small nuclear ribonucleoprotein [Methanococcus voltae]MBP2201396.1 small nuclear ribonucleoprotein [Methanococcus voltae]MCS3922191.1 small nuclear ribonucleoprotein [Methanococcus voltae PS]